MTELISVGDLIGKGLKAIQETWKPTLKYTIWFLLAPIAWYAFVLISILPALMASSVVDADISSVAGPVMIILWGVSFIVMMAGIFYAWVCLSQYMLAYAKGESMTNWKPRNPFSYLPGALWLYVLVCVPVFVGMLVAVLPAIVINNQNVASLLVALFMIAAVVFIIWLSIAFSQAFLLLINDEARGIAALKGSLELVNGRWWKTFWRLMLPNFVFYILVSTIMSAVFMLIFMLGFVFLGGWAAIMSATEGSAEIARGANVGLGIGGIIFLIVAGLLGIVMSVAQTVAQVVFQMDVSARLFWSLKHTKHSK